MIDLEDEQDRAINQQTNNILGTVAGWGWNDEDGVNMSSQLHRVQVPLMSRAECEKRFQTAGYSIPIDKTKLCAGWPEGGQDACQVSYQHFLPLIISRKNIPNGLETFSFPSNNLFAFLGFPFVL
jgi:hypothetical protein